jgi:hypothetical protein
MRCAAHATTTRSPLLGVIADPAAYSQEQCSAVLARIHEGSGGLQLVCKVRAAALLSPLSSPLDPPANLG